MGVYRQVQVSSELLVIAAGLQSFYHSHCFRTFLKKQTPIHSVKLECDSSLIIYNTFVDSVDAVCLWTMFFSDLLGGISKGLTFDIKPSFFPPEWHWLHYSYFTEENYV